MKRFLLIVCLGWVLGTSTFSQYTTEDCDYDFVYTIFTHFEADVTIDPLQAIHDDIVVTPINSFSSAVVLEHYNGGSTSGPLYNPVSEWSVTTIAYDNTIITSPVLHLTNRIEAINDDCATNITIPYSEGVSQIQEKTATFSHSQVSGRYYCASIIHPLLKLSIYDNKRFKEVGNTLRLSIQDKTPDNLSYMESAYTQPELYNVQINQPFNYSVKVQVRLANGIWKTLATSIDFNGYYDASYNSIVSALGTSITGKECQIRLLQAVENTTFSTIPISFMYLDEVPIELNIESQPVCHGGDGKISYMIGDLSNFSDDEEVQILFNLYEYSKDSDDLNSECESGVLNEQDCEIIHPSGSTLYLKNPRITENAIGLEGSTGTIDVPAGYYRLKAYILNGGVLYYPATKFIDLWDAPRQTASISPANNWNGYEVATGASSGKINVSISHGTPPYKYSYNRYSDVTTWSNYPGGQITAGYVAGDTVKAIYFSDANNCEPVAGDTCAFVRAPALSVSEIPDTIETDCPGYDGVFTFTISGGVGRYNVTLFSLNEFAYTYEYYNTTRTYYLMDYLPVGDYDLQISDISEGTSLFYEISVVDPEELVIDSVSFENINCHDDFITATVHTNSNSVREYFCWRYPPSESYSNTSGTFTGLTPGASYNFSYDGYSCFGPTVTITIPTNTIPELTTSTVLIDATCVNAGNGKAVITPVGGTPYSDGYLIENLFPPISDTNKYSSKEFSDLEVNTEYIFRTTDINGCATYDSISIGSMTDTLRINNIISTDAYCDEIDNGSLKVNINPGASPANSYTYRLYDNNCNLLTSVEDTVGLSCTFNGYNPGVYFIELNDASGCAFSLSDTIKTDPNEISFLPGEAISNTWCSGINTGSVAVGASGGFPEGTDYIYTIYQTDGAYYVDSLVSGSIIFTNLPEGVFNIIASDNAGCNDTLTNITIGVDNEPVSIDEFNLKHQYCEEQSASFTIHASSLSGSIRNIMLTYPNNVTELLAENGDASKSDLIGDSRDYSLLITDNMGCTKDSSFIINNLHNEPQISYAVLDSVACNSVANGRIQIFASQPITSGAFTFTLNESVLTDNSSVIYENLRENNGFELQVVGSSGCISDTIIPFPAIHKPVTISAFNLLPASCVRAENASAQLEASGSLSGSPAYYFVLNNSDTLTGASVEFQTYPVGGSNRIHLYDQYGCSDSTSLFAFPVRSDSLNLQINEISNVSCPGNSDGTIYVEAINGNPFPEGFYYRVIDPSDMTELLNSYQNSLADLTGLSAGNHRVEISDADNCLAFIEDIQINAPLAPEMLVTPGYVAQKGDSSGWINAHIQNGNGKYYLEWYKNSIAEPESLIFYDTTSSTASLCEIPAGTYLIRIQDSGACAFWDDKWLEETIVVPEPEDSLRLVLQELTPVSCNGLSDGAIILNAVGGWGSSYTYGTDFNNINFSSAVFDNLPAKTNYTFYASDTAGVITSASFDITEPEILSAAISELIDVNCYGYSDGKVILAIQGGNDTYSISTDEINWVEGTQIENLEAGAYTLYIRDNFDCRTSVNASISEPEPFVVSDTSITDTKCLLNEGSISATIEGGAPEYTYEWYEGSTYLGGGSPSIENLYSGAYALEVTDSKGCQQTFNFFVSDLTNLEISKLITNAISCWSGNDGSASLEIQNGVPPYEIVWYDSSSANPITGLSAGTYYTSVTDAEGCTVYQDFTITSPDSIRLTLNEFIEPLCLGVENGSIEVTASGGTPDYQYSWSTGRNRNNIPNLGTGPLQLIITDNNNCVKSYNFQINYTENISTSLPDELTLCLNNTYSLNSGDFEYVYWYEEGKYLGSESILEVDHAGKFVVEAEDARGCQTRDSIRISTSDIRLNAQLLMASIIELNDTLVVFEASDPVPDSIQLYLDETLFVLDSGQYYRHLYASDTGRFDFTLVSFLGGCQDIITKTLTVLPPGVLTDSLKMAHSYIISDVKLYPNPSSGDFSLELELNRKCDITLRLVSYGDGTTLLIRKLEGGDYYNEPFKLKGMIPGTYLLSIQAGNEMQTQKIIIY